ncbi:MAG: FkbM family methyltransferase [Bradyrhizobium sp.]|uniref:FkbM family methyltransferase n=1 Tax=Bradyrhizobium sp. TaxID=376 RepID=UPI003BF16B57
MKLLNLLTTTLLRPYVSRELPGWGVLYEKFVGGYKHESRWKGSGTRWVRGKLHGYEMLLDLSQWSNRQTFFLKRFYDLPTQLFLKRALKEGDTFVDVGANEGMMSLLASRLVGLSGRVIAFEPNAVPRSRLEAAIARNGISNIEVRPYGLGEINETLSFTVPKINTGEGSFAGAVYDEADVTCMECEVRRGDDVISRDIEIALIKLDVEGFELRALRGLAETIGRSKPMIVMETDPDTLARCGDTIDMIKEFLLERSYLPSLLSLKKKSLLSKRSAVLSITPTFPHASAPKGDFYWAPARWPNRPVPSDIDYPVPLIRWI